MTVQEAIKLLKDGQLSDSEVEAEKFNKAYNMALKALETVQRIDDVLNVEGMPEIDVLDEIMEAVSEFKYDCGVSE